jgi:hypothetical protein
MDSRATLPPPRVAGAPASLALHEAEEWDILRWYHHYWNNVGALSNRIVWTWLVFYSVLGFLVTLLATRFRSEKVTAYMVVFFFTFPFLHGFLHIYWVFFIGAYSPGVITSVVVLIPVCAALAVRGLRERLVPPWFVGLSLLLNLPQFVGAIRLGDTLPDGSLPFYRLSGNIAPLLFWP